jgi:hypothetical protein
LNEIDALHELHREEATLLFDDKLVQADQVRMRYTGEASKLLFQPVDGGGSGASHGLERDDLATNEILDLVDHSHSAGPEAPQHGETVGRGKVVSGDPIGR